MIKRSTIEIISHSYSYDEIVLFAAQARSSFAFNELYSLNNHVEYGRILLIGITYCYDRAL